MQWLVSHHCETATHAVNQSIINLTDLSVGSWRRTKQTFLLCEPYTDFILFFSRECEQVVYIQAVKELFQYFCEFKVYHDVNIGDISQWASFAKASLYLNTFLYLK